MWSFTTQSFFLLFCNLQAKCGTEVELYDWMGEWSSQQCSCARSACEGSSTAAFHFTGSEDSLFTAPTLISPEQVCVCVPEFACRQAWIYLTCFSQHSDVCLCICNCECVWVNTVTIWLSVSFLLSKWRWEKLRQKQGEKEKKGWTTLLFKNTSLSPAFFSLKKYTVIAHCNFPQHTMQHHTASRCYWLKHLSDASLSRVEARRVSGTTYSRCVNYLKILTPHADIVMYYCHYHKQLFIIWGKIYCSDGKESSEAVKEKFWYE